MNGEAVFETWRPPGPWAEWVKPALFTQFDCDREAEVSRRTLDVDWAPQAGDGVAIVVDLSGRHAIDVGLSLAADKGFRPVPLYNVGTDPNEVLDQNPILEGLCAGARELPRLTIDSQAAPAFLLDARRMKCDRSPSRGRFDNRWRVFPEDFPSAAVLHQNGITSVIAVQNTDAPQDDLAEVLLRWQSAGLPLKWKDPLRPGSPEPLTLQSSWLGSATLWALGPQRNRRGTFGIRISAQG